MVDSPESESEKNSCLWEKIDEDVEIKNSMISKFAEIFSRQQVKKNVTKEKPKSKKSQEVVHILDGKRAHNLNILITSLHLDISEIENAVYNLDTSSVGTDVLVKIKDELGTSDEMKKIKQELERNKDAPLGKPEQFLYDLNQIHCFSDRVTCIMFEINFNETITAIETKLSNFKLTCDQLVKSESIPQIFSIILTLGT